MIPARAATEIADARCEGHHADVVDRAAHEDLTLQACAERVRALKKVTTENIITIGKELLFAKAKLGRGRFGRWLRAEVMMSERTAERFMGAAKWAEGKTDTVSVLDPTSIYLLSAPSSPKHVTSEVMTRIAGGEGTSVEDVRFLIKVARSEQGNAKLKERATQKHQARARRQNLAGGQAEPWEEELRREKAAAAEFARLLRVRIDDIRGDLTELLSATNGAALVEALKMVLEDGPSLATPSMPDEVAPPADAPPPTEMPDIPPFLKRTLPPQADRPSAR